MSVKWQTGTNHAIRATRAVTLMAMDTATSTLTTRRIWTTYLAQSTTLESIVIKRILMPVRRGAINVKITTKSGAFYGAGAKACVHHTAGWGHDVLVCCSTPSLINEREKSFGVDRRGWSGPRIERESPRPLLGHDRSAESREEGQTREEDLGQTLQHSHIHEFQRRYTNLNLNWRNYLLFCCCCDCRQIFARSGASYRRRSRQSVGKDAGGVSLRLGEISWWGRLVHEGRWRHVSHLMNVNNESIIDAFKLITVMWYWKTFVTCSHRTMLPIRSRSAINLSPSWNKAILVVAQVYYQNVALILCYSINSDSFETIRICPEQRGHQKICWERAWRLFHLSIGSRRSRRCWDG